MSGFYAEPNKNAKNAWITDPKIEDPENLPKPLGWNLLVRPYPIAQDEDRSLILMPDDHVDFLNYVTCIGRIVAVGPCCWNRPEHKNKEGQQEDWAKIGDFVTYPKNVGARRNFKGVSYVLLTDDDILETLPDPQVFDGDRYKVNIPEEHLTRYNTVHKTKKPSRKEKN